jgi:hypothetical protein
MAVRKPTEKDNTKRKAGVYGNTVVLSEPFKSISTEITELTFSAPKGKQLRQFGMPMTFGKGADGESNVNMEVLGKYIEALAEPKLIDRDADKLGAGDFLNCMTVVADFFSQ